MPAIIDRSPGGSVTTVSCPLPAPIDVFGGCRKRPVLPATGWGWRSGVRLVRGPDGRGGVPAHDGSVAGPVAFPLGSLIERQRINRPCPWLD